MAAVHGRRGGAGRRSGLVQCYLSVRDARPGASRGIAERFRDTFDGRDTRQSRRIHGRGNNYLRTASILQELLDSQQGQLAPETIAQLKASLRTIDEAILEARNALARDPANRVLIEMLSASYRQKVDLLRRSTEMTRGS